MFSIGEFSVITQLTVKTLRHYHDQGILIPDYIDEDSGYRYYKESSIDRAMAIGTLRQMEFSIEDIREIVTSHSEDDELLRYLQTQREKIQAIKRKYDSITASIDSTIAAIEENSRGIRQEPLVITEKKVEDIIFGSTRSIGRYEDEGKSFREVGRRAGRHIAGKPMSLYYECEHMDGNADIESGFPLSKEISGQHLSSRILSGGHFATIIYRGPYEKISRAYAQLFSYAEAHNFSMGLPIRNIYLKGPGIFFRGNPEKYYTEIQIPLV